MVQRAWVRILAVHQQKQDPYCVQYTEPSLLVLSSLGRKYLLRLANFSGKLEKRWSVVVDHFYKKVEKDLETLLVTQIIKRGHIPSLLYSGWDGRGGTIGSPWCAESKIKPQEETSSVGRSVSTSYLEKEDHLTASRIPQAPLSWRSQLFHRTNGERDNETGRRADSISITEYFFLGASMRPPYPDKDRDLKREA